MSCALVKLLFYVDAKHLKKIALKRIHLSITWVYTENALDLTIIVNCFVWLFGLGGLCKKFLSQWLTQAFLNWNSKSIETETEINTGVTWRGVWRSHFKSPLVKTYWLQYTVRSATFLLQSSVNFLIFQVMFFWSPSSKQQERILHTGLIRKQKM